MPNLDFAFKDLLFMLHDAQSATNTFPFQCYTFIYNCLILSAIQTHSSVFYLFIFVISKLFH